MKQMNQIIKTQLIYIYSIAILISGLDQNSPFPVNSWSKATMNFNVNSNKIKLTAAFNFSETVTQLVPFLLL